MDEEREDIREFDNYFGCGVKNVGYDEEGVPQIAVTWVTADVSDYALSSLLSFMMLESHEFADIIYKAVEIAEKRVNEELEDSLAEELGVTFQKDEDDKE